MKKQHKWKTFFYAVTAFSAAASIYSLLVPDFPELLSILCYVIAAVTLFISIWYFVLDMRFVICQILKPELEKNPYAVRVASDYRLRTVLFAVPGLVGNVLFACFNAAMGIYNQSAWLGSMAAYYILLSVMRCGAVRQEKRLKEITDTSIRRKQEVKIYKRNSVLFIFQAIVLSGMVVLIEDASGGKSYPGTMIYAIAAYTFYRIILSVMNLFRVNKENSPLLTIIRRIGYVDACVSILMLQTAMFASFAEGEEQLVNLMNGITGSVVCLMVLGFGIYGVMTSRKLTGGYRDDSNTDCGR